MRQPSRTSGPPRRVLVADPAFMNAPAAQTGLDDVDFWIGGLAEDGMVFGGLLGSSFNYVFEQHLEALQNADRFYYLTRTQGLNIIHQLENNSFSELVLRNTDADNLHADIFANPDIVIDLDAAPETWPAKLLVQSGPRYRYDGAEHVVIHGTTGNDDIAGGDGDDSVWGHEGNDTVEGGMGNDILHGGHGDDTITDVFGDDTIHAGSGNDRVNAGSGLDLIFGGTGTRLRPARQRDHPVVRRRSGRLRPRRQRQRHPDRQRGQRLAGRCRRPRPRAGRQRVHVDDRPQRR